jgi:hypothetical protein
MRKFWQMFFVARAAFASQSTHGEVSVAGLKIEAYKV